MNSEYLFFDIESAGYFEGVNRICSFGYVITDEKFHILEQNDILINPESKFHWYVAKKILTNYDLDEFKKQDPFPKVYDEIKNLLVKENRINFAYAVNNDIIFLKQTCKRYNLDFFDFITYDVQRIYNEYMPSKSYVSLQSMHKELEIDKIKEFHRSDEDARALLYAMKNMQKDLEIPLVDFLKLCPNARVKSSDVKIKKKKKKKDKVLKKKDEKSE